VTQGTNSRPRFGVVLPTRSFAETRELAERAEAVGYDTVAVEDHFFMRSPMEAPEDPRLECFTALAAVAMVTRRVTLSQLVACNSYRHPVLTAKVATTLDHVSGGRLELGLGAGWFREEYDALGLPYPRPAVRIAQLAEALRIIKRLWREPVTDFAGEHYRLRGVYAEPKPLQARPRIMLGGSGPALLRLAAEEADVLNMIPPTGGRLGKLVLQDVMRFDVEEYRRRARLLADHARTVGRSPADIALSQFLFVTLGEDRASADAMLEGMARAMGLEDARAARHSPSVLVGDAEACRDELRQRARDLGVSYFLCRFPAREPMERFAEQVIARL
jgi:probable F420-dependent oxidoreductase